jgi:hypothetical protein
MMRAAALRVGGEKQWDGATDRAAQRRGGQSRERQGRGGLRAGKEGKELSRTTVESTDLVMAEMRPRILQRV